MPQDDSHSSNCRLKVPESVRPTPRDHDVNKHSDTAHNGDTWANKTYIQNFGEESQQCEVRQIELC
jgi:hypothetical protein